MGEIFREGQIVSNTSDAIKEEYLSSYCDECGFRNFPASQLCPSCLSTAVRKVELSREGRLYSYSTVEGTQPRSYVGYIDTLDQVRVFGRLVGFGLRLPECDMHVEFDSVSTDAGGPQLLFRPVAIAEGAR